MQNVLQQTAPKMNKRRKNRQWWQRVVRTMAMVVVFCTTYALILPAITMQAEPVCGVEAHTHEDACYTEQRMVRYACGLPEGALAIHTHDVLCYDVDGSLTCPLTEQALHVHTDSCYEITRILACESVHVHSDTCKATEQILSCTETEVESHAHSELCQTQKVLTCQDEGHAHEDGCYTVEAVTCALEETAGHTHGEACYTLMEVPCELTTNDGHVHEDGCYQKEQTQTCTQEELRLHGHDAVCYDIEGKLLCTVPQVVPHQHEETCVKYEKENVLICALSEHTHEDACYPVEESKPVDSAYFCGLGVHKHAEMCLNSEANLVCNIPEHAHEAACVVKDLDLNADVETAEQWKHAVDQLTFTGNWNEDLLTVALSQLGYTESAKNVVLVADDLKGYTRYGAAYGMPYADWNTLFVQFCLEYAEIAPDFLPGNVDCDRWIQFLTESGKFVAVQEHTPVAGELVFLNLNEDPKADFIGILAEEPKDGVLKLVAGDTENCVDYVNVDLSENTVVGYGILPENPMTQEQWAQAEALSALIQALPDAEKAKETFETLNEQGEKEAYEALRQELTSRMEAIYTGYESLNDLQKARVGSLAVVDALKELCGGTSWQDDPAMTEDNAVVSGLDCELVEIIPATVEAVAEETAEQIRPDNTIQDGDTVHFRFTVDTTSYYTDITYGQATVKVELVLPLNQERAVFDTAAMGWLVNSKLTFETRNVDGVDTICQVLTGERIMVASEASGTAVPGSFMETVPVKVVNMSAGEQLSLIISAAMTQGTWEGECPTHGISEKLTVATEVLAVYEPLSPEAQQAKYEAYLAQMEELRALEEVDEQTIYNLCSEIDQAYQLGQLPSTYMELISQLMEEFLNIDLNTVAEPATGYVAPDKVHYEPQITTTYSRKARTMRIPTVSAIEESPTALALTTSQKQVVDEGGQTQQDGITVSKTIAGTELENVFDITLEITTKDEVFEVIQEPDMAVVVVMDISNTMHSAYSGESTSRIYAAQEAATNFLKNFADEAGAVSRVGFVGFNTSAYEFFPMSECDTREQAAALAATVKERSVYYMGKNKNSVPDAYKSAGKIYDASPERYTNMEAGLKLAQTMLNGVSNEHKYVIFLTDGFPTTYIKSGTTGYNPEVSVNSKGKDGYFYDEVKNRVCWGTSYSDTAAIKARTQATTMKNAGITIFSIGVDVSGQTINRYQYSTSPIIERRNEASHYNTYGYEIGLKHSQITKWPLSDAEQTALGAYFGNWLGGSATSNTYGIGSGYYYSSTDTTGLEAAYANIFEKIKEINAASTRLDLVATDPMPEMGVGVTSMEFIGFWDYWIDKDNVYDVPVLASSLSGQSLAGKMMYNTATFNTDTQTISWDLKNSGYESLEAGDITNYAMMLHYRVRLKNEENIFVESKIYDTNDVTTMTYRTIDVTNGVPDISDQKTIQFEIPSVLGYLGELSFKKVDPMNSPLVGAEFTLSHDTENCSTCRGDGVSSVAVGPFVKTSGLDGIVTFNRIPSGHKYILTETKVPDNHTPNENTYKVDVAYDTLTVTVTDANGDPLEWTQTIMNGRLYVLPDTGSVGTSSHTFGGIFLIAAAALMYLCKSRRKQRKGGTYSR